MTWFNRSNQIHTGWAPQYLAHSVQSIAESSHQPGLRSANTADYIKRHTQTKFSERCFSHAARNSLPDSIKLTTDTNRFKSLLKTHLIPSCVLTFVSASGQFVSRAI